MPDPDAALNPSAASLHWGPDGFAFPASELVYVPVLYLLIIIQALIIAESFSSQGLSDETMSQVAAYAC
jgi:hypothetical protein